MRTVSILICLVAAAACGDDGGSMNNQNGDGGSGDGGAPDAHPLQGDAGPISGCTPGTTACSDCIDNDGDGRVDGADIECISADDRREDSFATGIPGDNSDPNKQDCFFDGNSGSAPQGMDDCIYSTCCLFPPGSGDECTEAADIATCDVSQECVDFCQPSAPPGCDCFGCCTVCDDAGCETITTNPSVVETDPLDPNACTQATIHDAEKCPPCVQDTECVATCDPDDCVLCPGQDESDLPEGCNEVAVCPGNQTVCETTDDCGVASFCANGCCVAQIE